MAARSDRKSIPWRLRCESSGRELILGEGSVDPESVLGEYGGVLSVLEQLGVVPCLNDLLPVELSWTLPFGSQVKMKLELSRSDGVPVLRPAGQKLDPRRLLACWSEEDDDARDV